jgi:hypothetical protein
MKHFHHIIPKHLGGTDDPSNLSESRRAAQIQRGLI